MTSESGMHPDASVWLEWVRARQPAALHDASVAREGLSGHRRAELAQHLERCDECIQQVRFLEQLEAAAKGGPWEAPPAHAVGSAHGTYVAAPSPPGQVGTVAMHWSPPDVRSAPGVVVEQTDMTPRVAAGALEAAQISVVATPPPGEGLWRVHGTVWLRRPDRRAIRVSLFADEHELAAVETHDGEPFTIDELLPPGWGLEIELPTGQRIQLQ